MFLYITNDKVGSETGGGQVTKHEIDFLWKLGSVEVLNPPPTSNPFDSEKELLKKDYSHYKLAHLYAGTFPNLVKKLKSAGVKVTYTIAAHDVDISRTEFQNLGMEFNFPHLNDKELFEQYTSAYRNADVVICPSTVAEKTNQKYGVKKTAVIPHGHEPVECLKWPKTFTVGYLGQCGPDKGLRYLIEAWSMLNYKDCVLNLAGSQSPSLLPLIRHFQKGNYNIQGWVDSLKEFYNRCSIYVQPSATEGFGIEVLEAMSAGRPVVVSDGAGAADVVPNAGIVVEKCNSKQLADAIDMLKTNESLRNHYMINSQRIAKEYTWDKVGEKYLQLWKGILA